MSRRATSGAPARPRGLRRRTSAKHPRRGTRGITGRAASTPLVAAPLVAAWLTSQRTTAYLVERLPAAIWASPVPGVPHLAVRGVLAHLHNSRCSWIKALGARHGITPPRMVDLRRVTQRGLLGALSRSSRGILRLMELGMARGGTVPRANWQNFPTDLAHFLSYFVAHEAHHRGQLCLIARQLGHRLPREVASGLWQWTRRSREA